MAENNGGQPGQNLGPRNRRPESRRISVIQNQSVGIRGNNQGTFRTVMDVLNSYWSLMALRAWILGRNGSLEPKYLCIVGRGIVCGTDKFRETFIYTVCGTDKLSVKLTKSD